MKSQEGGILFALMVITILVLFGWGVFATYYFSTNHHNVTFSVNKSERVCDSGKNGSCRYLIYTSAGVYKDTDSLINGKFNSSDLYGQLQSGKQYSCDAVGYRSGFLSEYENLISCEETGNAK